MEKNLKNVKDYFEVFLFLLTVRTVHMTFGVSGSGAGS
jgi:hypothetical protein